MRPSSQMTRELNGITTEVLLQNFADRVLVLVTQLGKVGNLVCRRARDPQSTVQSLKLVSRYKQAFRLQRFCLPCITQRDQRDPRTISHYHQYPPQSSSRHFWETRFLNTCRRCTRCMLHRSLQLYGIGKMDIPQDYVGVWLLGLRCGE